MHHLSYIYPQRHAFEYSSHQFNVVDTIYSFLDFFVGLYRRTRLNIGETPSVTVDLMSHKCKKNTTFDFLSGVTEYVVTSHKWCLTWPSGTDSLDLDELILIQQNDAMHRSRTGRPRKIQKIIDFVNIESYVSCNTSEENNNNQLTLTTSTLTEVIDTSFINYNPSLTNSLDNPVAFPEEHDEVLNTTNNNQNHQEST